MDLATRDHKIIQLKAELENRKKLLCMKRRQLKTNVRENHFLKDVVDDYDTYNKHIISQKEKQVVFLQMLNQYIDNINQDLSLTNNQLQNSKHEQREILKEITYLKNEIDDLVKTTDEDINSNSIIDE
jgi:hypothetical protein